MSNLVNNVSGNKITLYNVRIGTRGYRNFGGRVNEYNTSGERYFIIFPDNDTAKMLEANGAPVLWKDDRYNPGQKRAQMKVHVKYKDRYGKDLTPPKVVMITKANQTLLDESTVSTLDTADIERADMILNMYANKSGMGAENSVALKTLYATLAEDELDALYSAAAQNEDAPW